MNKTILVYLAIVLPGAIIPNLVSAHGGRVNSFNFGIQLGYPGYYGYGYNYYDPFFYPPFYNYPPVVVPMMPPVIVPATPPVYIQQQEEPATVQPQTNDWYYCQDPEGYYPYVKQCPGGWMRVNPHPPAQ